MSSALRRRKKAEGKRPGKEGLVEEGKVELKKMEKAAVRAAKKVEKAAERKPEKKASPPKPMGRVPQAMVMARHGTGMTSRTGRGFSRGELSGGGVPSGSASMWGLRVDPRRRSVLQGNVSSLRTWLSGGWAKARAGRGVEKVEEELKQAGEEVAREVVAVERKAAKAEKAIKKEVKKAEKAVKEQVEKAKARSKKKVKT